MATSMGNDGIIKVGSTSNTIGQVQSWSLDSKADIKETYSMGEDWKSALSGVKSWSGSLQCYFDPDDVGQEALFAGEKIEVHFYPSGDNASSQYFSGTAVISKVPVSAQKDGVIMKTIEFTGSGALSSGSVS